MKVVVLGAAQTKFGELWDKSLSDLLAESQLAAIEDSGIKESDIDAIFTGNMCAGIFSNQGNIGSIAAGIIHSSVPSTVVTGACASGGLAVRAGIHAILSGQAKIVLVNGVEKMTDVGIQEVTKGLSSAASSEWEQVNGATFPGLNAMIAHLYMHTYGLTRDQLAQVSVQNHEHALANPKAHFRRKISIDDVIHSPMVADPLTMLDCSPISDGAASVILCDEQAAKKCTKKPVFIIGSGQASDTALLASRDNLLEWKANKIAAEQAFSMANVTPLDIDIAEIHDAFSIVQILSLEDLGFFEKGKAGIAISQGKTTYNSGLVVNPSGGLKAKGHPVGATGVAQIVEITKQLQKRSKTRPVENARFGFAHNVGGCGTTCTVHILAGGEHE